MSRILIPRSSACSSKVVGSVDWECYFSDILTDHVICGFALSVGCGTRSIDVALGKARVLGLHLNNSTSCCDAVACLAVCDTHSIYIRVDRDCMCRPSGWTFTSNTTDTTPTDSFKIGTATTDCTGTTASVTTCGTAKETTIAQGSAFPTDFTTCRLFYRTDEGAIYRNTGTEQVPIMTGITLRSSTTGLPTIGTVNSMIHTQTKSNGFFFSDGCNWICTTCQLTWCLASVTTSTNCFDCGAEWTEQCSTLISVDCATAGVLDIFMTGNGACNSAATADLGGACFLDASNWVIRFKMQVINIGCFASGTANQVWLGFSDEDSASDHANLKDFLGMVVYSNTTNGDRINVARTNNASMLSATVDCCNWQGVSACNTYYIEISRNTTNVIMRSFLGCGACTFDDKAVLKTATVTTSTITNLRYFGVWNENNVGGAAGDIDLHIDELQIYDSSVRIA